jgi:hypothetical protein
VTVPRKPDHGGIDPNSLMIDLRVDDNMMERTGDKEGLTKAPFIIIVLKQTDRHLDKGEVTSHDHS